MARIKITGFIDTDDLDDEDVDLEDKTGLTSEGFDKINQEFELADLRIELQP